MKGEITENDVKKDLKAWFDKHGAWSYAPVQSGRGVNGVPDRVGGIPIVVTQEMVGKKIAVLALVEAKKPGRRGEKNAGASELQVGQLITGAEAGAIVYVVDSNQDLLMLDAILRELNKGPHHWIATITSTIKRRLGHG